MKNAIENNIPIHVDLRPVRDEIHSGICIKFNENVYISICFNDELKKFDGFGILRSNEIQQYRYWDEEELSEIKRNNYKAFLEKLSLDKMNSFYDCLNELKDIELIAIYTNEDEDSNYIGKIESVNTKNIELKLLSDSAEWLDTIKIIIDEINYIGFDSSYEKKLIKKLQEI